MKNVITIFLVGLYCGPVFGQSDRFSHSSRLQPNDYLYGAFGEKKDDIFDQARSIDLGLDLSIGADCGRIDFRSTLRGALKNVLDAKYFGDMGKNILAASPMLAVCYFSPTWCSILKQSQLSANALAGMRLKQCGLIDKYVDGRVEDYYQERQRCVQKAIQSNGGNAETAMEQCKSGGLYTADLTNWSGAKYGDSSSKNALIGSSAKWAEFNGADSSRVLDLVKSMVGDTVISRGKVSVDFGPKELPQTPRIYLKEVRVLTNKKLCNDIVQRVVKNRHTNDVSGIVTESELKELSSGSDELLLDHQTIRSLSMMSFRQRKAACKKLADALSLTNFAHEMNRSLDVLTTLSQNPNLPKQRKEEISRKREMLKDSVEMTLELSREKEQPLNHVLAQINKQGSELQDVSTRRALDLDASRTNSRRTYQLFMDCSDGLMCGRR